MSKRFDVLCIGFLSSILFGSVGAIADDKKSIGRVFMLAVIMQTPKLTPKELYSPK